MALDIGKGRTDVAFIRWQGLDKVIANLNKEAGKIKGLTRKNLLTAGLLVKGKAQRITPVDTANLKSSAYVVVGGGGKSAKQAPPKGNEGKFKDKAKTKGSSIGGIASKMSSDHQSVISMMKKASINPFAIVGFTANYALFVHENLAVSHAKKASIKTFGKRRAVSVQVGQAKFLEQALAESHGQILTILKRGIE